MKYSGFIVPGVTGSQGKHLLNKITVLADIDGCVTSIGDPVLYISRGFIRVLCNIGFMLD